MVNDDHYYQNIRNHIDRRLYPYLYQYIEYLIANNPKIAHTQVLLLAIDSTIGVDSKGEREQAFKNKYGGISPEDYRSMLELGLA